MKKMIFVCLLLGGTLVGCGDDDDESLYANDHDDDDRDGAVDVPGDGICDLSACPEPDEGIACCAPNGACGSDPSGLGFICVANSGEGNVCVLEDCPEPTVGNACCTPFGTCGFDPFESNVFCIANPPVLEEPPPVDSGIPSCDPSECPEPQVGLPCCLPTGLCGVDTFSIGFCFGPPLPAVDGGLPPPISVTPPDDPSVDGQCPSFIGLAGEPVWGCCSGFGVCGTFAGETCFLPAGTQIPVSSDEDAGALNGVLLCNPPAAVD